MGKSDRLSLSIVALGLGVIIPLFLLIGSLPSSALAQGGATPTPTSVVWLGSAISGSGSRAAGQDAVNLLLNYTVPSNNYGYGYVVLRKSDTGTWQHVRTTGDNQIDPNSAACWFKANLANAPGFGGNDNNYWCNWAITQIVQRGYTLSGNINAAWSDSAYSPGSTVSAGERITCPDYQYGQDGVQCKNGSSSHEFYVFPLYYGWPPQPTVTPTVTSTMTPTIPLTCTNVLVDGGMEQFQISSAWTQWGYAEGISKFGRIPTSLMDSVLNGGPACESRFQLIGWWPNLFSSPVNYGQKIYQDFDWPGGDMYWKFQARSNYRLLRFGEHSDARAEVSIQYVTNQGSERVAYPYDTLINEPIPEDWNEYSGVIEDVPEGIYSIYLDGRYQNANDIDRWTVYFDDVAISNCPLVGNCTLQTTPVYTPTSTVAPCDIPDLLNPDFYDDANNVTSLAYWSYASNETFALDPAAIPNGDNYEGVIAVGHNIGIRQNFRITNICGDGMLYVRTRGSGGAIISLRNLDTGQEYTQPGYDYGFMIMNYGLVGFRVPPGNYRLKILPWSSSQQYSYLWLDYVCLKMGDYSGYSECEDESGNTTATSSVTPGTPIPTPTPRPSRTPTQGPTKTPTPTNTAIPTITPFPTWTPKATWTASAIPPTRTSTPTYPPTNTSAPTHTDEPTDTP
ncbi:MAG: hypothetical protein NWE95_13770, partial [Candidatus Bathyarchaeota archaeon]|nr:hypothetical protein [Candidatus Bathyarchaeota archaeon]